MTKIYGCVLICLLSCTTAYTQTKVEEKVAATAERLRLAMVSGDKQQLLKLTARKLSYGHARGFVENKDEFIKSLTGGAADFVSIIIKDENISVTRKTAIVRHIMAAETNDNNKPGRVKLKVIMVFVKIKGHWKLLARQAQKAM
jgi:hypothetical protein